MIYEMAEIFRHIGKSPTLLDLAQLREISKKEHSGK